MNVNIYQGAEKCRFTVTPAEAGVQIEKTGFRIKSGMTK